MNSNAFILNCFCNYCDYVNPYIVFMRHNILLIFILLFILLEVFVHIAGEDEVEDYKEIDHTKAITHFSIMIAAVLFSLMIMTLPFTIPIIIILVLLVNNKGVHYGI